MRREGKLLAWCFMAIIAVGLAVYFGNRWQGEGEAQVIYDSFIVACHRNNPVREGLYKFAEAAAIVRGEAAAKDLQPTQRKLDERAAREYSEVATGLLTAPHVRTNGSRVGSTKCAEAITQP